MRLEEYAGMAGSEVIRVTFWEQPYDSFKPGWTAVHRLRTSGDLGPASFLLVGQVAAQVQESLDDPAEFRPGE